MRSGRTTSGLIGVAIVVASIGVFMLWRANQRPAATESTAPPTPALALSSDSLTLLARPRPVPIVNFVNGDGKPMTTADFGGRTVLLNIWATWCAPCRKEMPTLDRLEQKLGGPNFEVVALSIDHQGRDVVARFYRELGVKALRIYLDSSAKAIGPLEVVGLPTTLLIDRNGYEIGRKIGPAQWDSAENVKLIRRYIATTAGAGNAKPGSGAAAQ
ncbi:MAG TPA: TlpA disulfide reductase family protein [Stellaceae bacterium]|nr:TlpA disulfide reductase family protein [Stellaceae bacterium]